MNIRKGGPVGALAAIVVTVLAVGGCSSSTPEDTAPSSLDIRVAVWTSDERQLEVLNSIGEAFTESDPEVNKVVFETLPGEDYFATLQTQMAGGKAPDLAWVTETFARDFIDSGAFTNVEDTFASTEGYDLADLTPAATELWRDHDGDLHAYPFSTSPLVMFVNNDLLEAAGLPSSKQLQAEGQWNWEALSDLGAQINARTGKTGFIAYNYAAWDVSAGAAMGFGAIPWSGADGERCEMNSKAMRTYYEYLRDAAFVKNSMPRPGTQAPGTSFIAPFFAGDAGFAMTQISQAQNLAPAEEGGFNWDILPLPEGVDGDYSLIGQAAVGVLSRGKNPEVSERFLAFMTNPENSEKLTAFWPPARQSLLKPDVLAATSPSLSSEQIAQVVIPAIENGSVRAGHRNFAEIQATIQSSLDPIWETGANVEDVLNEVCRSVSPLLEEE